MNILDCKKDFPIFFSEAVSEKKLVYLDSASTSQKPIQVLQAMTHYYEHNCSNVHRGVHALADKSTYIFEKSRKLIAEFFGTDSNSLILTRNTTEALNWIVPMWLGSKLVPGKSMIVTEMEHHSNFVPWQQVCKKSGADFKIWPVEADGTLDLKKLSGLLNDSVAAVAVSHVSNVLGTQNPIEEIVQLCKKYGTEVIVDGAQSAPHLPINFSKMGAGFFAFSGHKMLGPMGIGGLLVRPDLLNICEPAIYGGGMIDQVDFFNTTFADLPDKFIPGTPDVASTVGLAAACEYLQQLSMNNVFVHESELVRYALDSLSKLPEVSLIGPIHQQERVGSVAFVYSGVHGHDVAQVLDSEGVAVRSGHHCAMPLHRKFGWNATVRASFSVYNMRSDVDALIEGLQKVRSVFRK